jgi:hypothetical protein
MRFDFKCAPARIVRHEDGAYVRYADWQRTEAARVAAERAYERHIDVAIEVLKERDQLRAQMDRLQASFDRVNADWLRQDKEIGELQRQLAESQKDAERYRWLRRDDIKVLPGQDDIYVSRQQSIFFRHIDVLVDSELDAAIDAEMAASPMPQWPHPDGFGGGLMGEK